MFSEVSDFIVDMKIVWWNMAVELRLVGFAFHPIAARQNEMMLVIVMEYMRLVHYVC